MSHLFTDIQRLSFGVINAITGKAYSTMLVLLPRMVQYEVVLRGDMVAAQMGVLYQNAKEKHSGNIVKAVATQTEPPYHPGFDPDQPLPPRRLRRVPP